MKPLILSMLIVAGLAAGVANAETGSADRGASWRQNNQQQRIQQDWRAGDLNRADRYIYNERHDGNRRDLNDRRDNGKHNGWDNGRHVGWDNDRNGRGVERRDAGWVDRSQWQQREMLERGVRSGKITRAEFRQLSAEQRAIRQEERAYRSDGRLSGAERTDLRQDLQTAWRNIRTEMGDGERQYYYGR